MKKSFLESFCIYPILFSAVIVLTLAAANMVNLSYFEITQAVLLLCALVGVIIGLVYLIIRDAQRVSFIVFIATIWAAFFGLVVSMIKSRIGLSMDITHQIIFIVIWSFLFGLIGSPWLWRRIQKPETITAYMNVLMIVLIGITLVRIFSFQSGQMDLIEYGNTFPKIQYLKMSDKAPDIYYIIVDGYGRANTLKEIYGWDNSTFLDYLKSKGFYIATESQTNYVQTAISLASSLNFDYLPNDFENSSFGRPFFYFIQHSRLFQTLETLGYTSYAFQPPYEASNIIQADHFISGNQIGRTHTLIGLLMMNSILSIPMELDLVKAPFITYAEQQKLFVNNLAALGKLPNASGPKFVFMHLLIPHPPFIFDNDGPITPNKVYALTDANLFQGTPKQYIKGYLSQAEYLNQALERILEQIMSNSPTPPVIILQGDHGPGAFFDQTISETCLKERFGILNAYFLPGIDQNLLYPSISPVNTFRLILNEYFNGSLELLPDQHYYSNFSHPFRFIAVGEELNQPCILR